MAVGFADPVGSSLGRPAVFVLGLVARSASGELLGGVAPAPLPLGLAWMLLWSPLFVLLDRLGHGRRGR